MHISLCKLLFLYPFSLLSRNCINRFKALKEADTWLEDQDAIIDHVMRYLKSLYSEEDWDRPHVDNLEFDCIGGQKLLG